MYFVSKDHYYKVSSPGTPYLNKFTFLFLATSFLFIPLSNFSIQKRGDLISPLSFTQLSYLSIPWL